MNDETNLIERLKARGMPRLAERRWGDIGSCIVAGDVDCARAAAEIERLRADRHNYDTPAWRANDELNGTVEKLCEEIDRLKAALADRQATVDAFNRELSRDQGLAIRYRTALLAISEMQTTENMRRVAEGALADAPVAAWATLENAQ